MKEERKKVAYAFFKTGDPENKDDKSSYYGVSWNELVAAAKQGEEVHHFLCESTKLKNDSTTEKVDGVNVHYITGSVRGEMRKRACEEIRKYGFNPYSMRIQDLRSVLFIRGIID